MSTKTFPTRPEGPHDLPNGTRVWIKTLNSTFRGRADDAGVLAGRIASMPVRKGGSAYTAVYNTYKAMSAEDQAAFVGRAYLNIGHFHTTAEDLFPDPVEPERKSGEDEATFLQRMDAYDTEIKSLVQKREDKVKSLFEAKCAEVTTANAKERVEACMNAVVVQRYYSGFAQGYNRCVIYYAARQFDDHDEFFYGDDLDAALKKIDDLDDEIKDSITTKYGELDVKSREIPT